MAVAEYKRQLEQQIDTDCTSWVGKFIPRWGGIDFEITIGEYGYRLQTANGKKQALQETEEILFLANEGTLLDVDNSIDLKARRNALILRKEILEGSRSYGFVRLPRR